MNKIKEQDKWHKAGYKDCKQDLFKKITEIRNLTPEEKGKSLDYWEGYTRALVETINLLK